MSQQASDDTLLEETKLDASTEIDSLLACLSDTSRLAIVCHNNPDPDCLASALALERIAIDADVTDVTLLYSGDISHQQNRVFVNSLDIDLKTFDDVDVDNHNTIALVDSSIPGENNGLPPDTDIDIVIDHHPGEEPDAEFVARREEASSTTTILVEYLYTLDVQLESDLATAMLFAIRRETLDFIRNVTEKEYLAGYYLHSSVDPDLLRKMDNPPLSEITLDAIGTAVQTRTVQSAYLVANVGRTTERDALPQAADYLLNLEGVETVLVYGISEGDIEVSARSTDSRVNLGSLLDDVFGDLGEAGGHDDMAAAKIPMGLYADACNGEIEEDLLKITENLIERRFFTYAGYEDTDISNGA
ncbi:DHH family phosphoesterase [Haladaptatus halobius]|uniref:DHH family phosphoesterase n=1 Tax=Haladaptatus halobius TaxID=2884875 RepID=UPI001D0A53FB|nr:bifunctional oligoribonuclease/PAP phosphatase NrnA [Haladaptatus halobius]